MGIYLLKPHKIASNGVEIKIDELLVERTKVVDVFESRINELNAQHNRALGNIKKRIGGATVIETARSDAVISIERQIGMLLIQRNNTAGDGIETKFGELLSQRNKDLGDIERRIGELFSQQITICSGSFFSSTWDK